MTSKELQQFRLGYFNTVRPVQPSIEGVADCQWGFAFGRGSYGDKELGKILHGMGAKDDHDISVFERLRRDNFLPGATNEEIGAVAWNRFMEPPDGRFPFFGQWEINYVLWRDHQKEYEINIRHLRAVWPPADSTYYPTPDVARDLSSITMEEKFNTPHVLAHINHIQRVIAVCWYQGWAVLADSDVSIKSWDPVSVQPATRRFFSWNPLDCWFYRETIARPHHLVFNLATLTPPR